MDHGKGILSSGAGGVLLWAPEPSSQSGGNGTGEEGHCEPIPGVHGVREAGKAAPT